MDHDGTPSGQMSIVILDIAELTPNDHLLWKIDQMASFELFVIL